MCLFELLITNATVGAISDSYHGFNWAQGITGLQSSTGSSKLVQNVFEGDKRNLAKPVQKKKRLLQLYYKLFK